MTPLHGGAANGLKSMTHPHCLTFSISKVLAWKINAGKHLKLGNHICGELVHGCVLLNYRNVPLSAATDACLIS